MNESLKKPATAIAIIGMAGRFPGARNLEQFWQNLRNGTESLRNFSDEELLAAGVDPRALENPAYVKAGTHLDDAALFDAGFFGVSPREAEVMDPQHRAFLECSWEALEDSGYNSDTYAGLNRSVRRFEYEHVRRRIILYRIATSSLRPAAIRPWSAMTKTLWPPAFPTN